MCLQCSGKIILLQLLDDLSNQMYKPSQVIVVDATQNQKGDNVVIIKSYPFELKVIWQQSKEVAARNEAI
jgi:hypothetical protein